MSLARQITNTELFQLSNQLFFGLVRGYGHKLFSNSSRFIGG
jgi:hypothetical protein